MEAWVDGQVDRRTCNNALVVHGFDRRTLVRSRHINQVCSICELVPEIFFRLKTCGGCCRFLAPTCCNAEMSPALRHKLEQTHDL